MDSVRSFIGRARAKAGLAADRLRRGSEAEKAAAFWGHMPGYHATPDDGPAIERSTWVAKTVLPSLNVTSVLEIGSNNGRNLAFILDAHPEMRLKGIDVNPRAIAYAHKIRSGISFEVADANKWTEPPDSWDVALTMSLLDHIPDSTIDSVAADIARTVRYVIAVELWDGSEGTRDLYKYSRDTRALFERHGFETLTWEKAPGQYDEVTSLLWAYVGRRR